jgi:hypothetical protein
MVQPNSFPFRSQKHSGFTKKSLYLFILIIFLSPGITSGQETKGRKVREFKKRFQVALFPGISTNGPESGSYINKVSINIFGGLSASNQIFEFSPVSNVEVKGTTGIQVAGLANIIGANAFINLTVAEERDVMHAGFKVNAQGIQVAGLINFILNQATGIQFAGALNVVGDDFTGVQISGIGNSSGGYVMGLQAAGFYNIAKESISGVQVSSLFNYTEGEMSGTQIALVNKAKRIEGKKSTPPTSARGLQFGFVNICKSMDGVQVGLVNFGGEMRGKQIGLVNFFKTRAPMERVRSGTPIGLLNFGSKGSYFRYQANELYSTNFEWTSGNCLNCSRVLGSEMPFDDRNQIFNQNSLIVGFNPGMHSWGFGYGFQKLLYSKLTIMPSPFNRKRMITYGVKFLHLNRSSGLDRSRNLLTKLNLDYGKRWRGMYIFSGFSLNYFVHEKKDPDGIYRIRSTKINAGKPLGLAGVLWPGYAFGVQF